MKINKDDVIIVESSQEGYVGYTHNWLVSKEVYEQSKETNKLVPFLQPQQIRYGIGIDYPLGMSLEQSFGNRKNFPNYTTDLWFKKWNSEEDMKLIEQGVYGYLTCNIWKDKIYLDVISINHKYKRNGIGRYLIENLLEENPNKELIVSPIETRQGKLFFEGISEETLGKPVSEPFEKYTDWIEWLDESLWKPVQDELWKGKETEWETTEELDDGKILTKKFLYGYNVSVKTTSIDKDGKDSWTTRFNPSICGKYHTENGRYGYLSDVG